MCFLLNKIKCVFDINILLNKNRKLKCENRFLINSTWSLMSVGIFYLWIFAPAICWAISAVWKRLTFSSWRSGITSQNETRTFDAYSFGSNDKMRTQKRMLVSSWQRNPVNFTDKAIIVVVIFSHTRRKLLRARE